MSRQRNPEEFKIEAVKQVPEKDRGVFRDRRAQGQAGKLAYRVIS